MDVWVMIHGIYIYIYIYKFYKEKYKVKCEMFDGFLVYSCCFYIIYIYVFINKYIYTEYPWDHYMYTHMNICTYR